jgi:hypothetical protein
MSVHVMIAEVTNGSAILPRLTALGWGRMFSQKPITPLQYEKWGFDNEGFLAWQEAGFPRDLPIDDWCILWDADRYERRCKEAQNALCDPFICVAPDIPGSKFSLEWTKQWLSELQRGWPWYLALQDGMKENEVEQIIHNFSGLFLGGTDRFKQREAWRWCEVAHRHQKKFHYGRAGTERKLKHAIKIGADSLDSSYPLWTKPRFANFAHLWQHGDGQAEMIQ